jgi:hypothetical protein
MLDEWVKQKKVGQPKIIKKISFLQRALANKLIISRHLNLIDSKWQYCGPRIS